MVVAVTPGAPKGLVFFWPVDESFSLTLGIGVCVVGDGTSAMGRGVVLGIERVDAPDVDTVALSLFAILEDVV